ncbi:MAG TPA: YqcI/YcgG family protein [Bacillota bacterium]
MFLLNLNWPEVWLKNPDDLQWEFIFNQEPIFISDNMPAYKNRITRNIGKS